MGLTLKDSIRSIPAQRPGYYWVLVGVTVAEFLLIGYILLSVFEILPETENTPGQNGLVLDRGDRLIWLGMEVTPVSRVIRKEFSIPRKIKGVFVLEGGDLAEPCGIRTGDIIRSINRQSVSDRRSLIRVANDIHYTGGVLLDIYRDGGKYFVTLQVEYPYGPLAGPYRRQWQLGQPLWEQAFPYGPWSGGQ